MLPRTITNHSDDAIRNLIAIGRERFAAVLPPLFDGSEHFTSPIWNVTPFRIRSTKPGDRHLYFTRYRTLNEPLPEHFVNVVKSWIILESKSISNMVYRLDMARLLWEASLGRRSGNPNAFTWDSLSQLDLSQAEILMREHLALSTTYKMASYLVVLNDFLAAHSICRPLFYSLQTPRTESLDRHTIAGQEARLAKLPSPRALEGLADIYAHYATDPSDRLRLAALALLIVSGFRAGELLTLPEDCEVKETRHGKPRYGLRYYPEKAQGDNAFSVRWLSELQRELAEQAVSEIRDLTAEARTRARVLEANPNTVPLPGYSWNDTITTAELVELFGVKKRTSINVISPERLPRTISNRRNIFRVADVQRYLREERVENLWTIRLSKTKVQSLSETLLIGFRHFFESKRGTNPLLVDPVVIQQLSDIITGRENLPSIFERFDIREDDGTVCRMTLHQFRHWLNDIADKGGLPIELQSRWFGRQNSRDTKAYQHMTTDQRIEWLKAGVRDGDIRGAVAEVYHELPEKERDIFLDGQVQAVHVTPIGLCIHNYAIAPCPHHLNCLRGCNDYLRTKGSKQEIIHLTEVKCHTERALVDARANVEKYGEPAQSWVASHVELLDGISNALAVETQLDVADGALVQPSNGSIVAPRN